MKYIIATLGCKVNQYETQAMETILMERGHEAAVPGEIADLVIVNTCAVTAESGRKSRQTIRRLRGENPGAKIAVCGCYSQIEPEEVQRIGADVVYGTADRVKLADMIEQAEKSGEQLLEIDRPFSRKAFEVLPAGPVSGRTRAMLKIQDGCANFCTYCIIPYTRGRLRSLPLEAAAKEASRLEAEGYRELVLTGIEIASYGVDLPDRPDLADLILTCAQAAPNLRLRFGSLEPTVITEEFCERLKAADGLCRHFHLSLQSGCDKTLKNMNRKYDTGRFYETVQLLNRYYPGCALTTDLITGFPGETEDDHAETLEFIRKCAFADMHIFPYSRRPGTPADRMDGQCTNTVKSRRAREAQKVADEMRLTYMQRQLGKKLRVLFESGESGIWTGHTDNYLPVKAEGEALHGKMRTVLLTGTDGETMSGRIVDEV